MLLVVQTDKKNTFPLPEEADDNNKEAQRAENISYAVVSKKD